MASPKKKVTLYFSAGMLDDTQREAIRQDRSISWIIQAAWRIAREEVQRLPGYGGQAGAVVQVGVRERRPTVSNRDRIGNKRRRDGNRVRGTVLPPLSLLALVRLRD